MAEDMNSANKTALGVIIILFIFLGLLVASMVVSQNRVKTLLQEISTVKEKITTAESETARAKAELAQEMERQAAARESTDTFNNPAVRLSLLKRFAARVGALLSKQNKANLDAIVIYIEKEPAVLTEGAPLPASYSAQLKLIKQEIKETVAATVAKKMAEQEAASPSALIGKTFDLRGTLALVKADPLLGGSYFVLTATNYGEPYYLYLNSTTATQAQSTMEGKIVEVKVKVTGQGDGYVTYDVVSGPALAK